ncbi:MAG: DUF4129 domain-containing protein [Brachybacterium sp.]|nr:DUF4129 domain-containing protein [Brachybacterium sp.]
MPSTTSARDTAAEATATRRRRLAAAVAAFATVVIALAALGAGSSTGDVGVFDISGADFQIENDDEPVQGPADEPDWSRGETPPARDDAPRGATDLTGTIMMILAAAGSLILLVLVVLVVRRLLEMRRPREAPEPPVEESEAMRVQDVQIALEEARGTLRTEQLPADAIVRAWLTLEDAVRSAGVARRPNQTTSEYVVRVLADVDLDERDLADFADLYRRSLFDAEPVGETDRERAGQLLDRLAAQLGGGAR